jgi:hypothetical protein
MVGGRWPEQASLAFCFLSKLFCIARAHPCECVYQGRGSCDGEQINREGAQTFGNDMGIQCPLHQTKAKPYRKNRKLNGGSYANQISPPCIVGDRQPGGDADHRGDSET